MTKRETAILATKVVAAYLVVNALLNLIRSPVALLGLIRYGRVLTHGHIRTGIYAVEMLTPMAWGLVLAALFWIWSPRIGAWIFSDGESDTEMGTLAVYGWISVAAVLYGIWLIINVLPTLCISVGMLVYGSHGSGITSDAWQRGMQDISGFAATAIAHISVGCCLLMTHARIAGWLGLRRGHITTSSRDMLIIGIKLIAAYIFFSELGAMPSGVTGEWARWSSYSSMGRPKPFEWTTVGIGLGSCIVYLVIAILAWRFAVPIARLLYRSSLVKEAESPEPAQPV